MGISADERSVAGGGSPEPGESDGDPENLYEPDDEELDEMVSDDESDTISVFTDIPEEISPDSDYAKKLLEDEIIRGSGFSNGKFRISEYVSENSPSKDELAKFLKNEYGIGGSSRNDDPVSFSNHDGKGIELVLSNRQVIRFNWKKVAEAVRSAVNSGKYITESDIETRRRMTLFDAQRFAIHYEYPHCLYNDRLDYIRKEITACGLDFPIRLNADMFAVYAAECVRTKPHVKESYQKIDRSSIDIPWKFNDWSEAAEAGRNLPVDSGYGQFRAMCRDSVSELISEISSHTGCNPVLGFPEEEITEFFASGEPLTSDSVDKITSEVFGYLYNQKQHSRLSYNNPTVITAPEQPAEQFTLFGDNEFTMEEPQADELPDESLNRAAAYIKDYFEQEFGSAAEIEDPSHVDLAYTTDEENDAVISVYADLVQYRITTEYGGNIAREEQYNSLDEMNELALKFLSFDDLISLSDEEKGLEVRHGAAVESNESEVRHRGAPIKLSGRIENEMKEKGFVIDHMDNESHNCRIENLYFLKEAYNKAKGMTFDQENKDKRFIALTISRNFDTELFQITISFNYPATLQLEGFEHPAVIELAYLLYEGDYRTVIADAQDILMDYKNDYVFRPEKLRAIDYHIEGCIGKALPPEVHEEYLSGTHGHGVVYFNRLAPQRGWSKETKEKFFILTDLENSQQYQIKLVL